MPLRPSHHGLAKGHGTVVHWQSNVGQRIESGGAQFLDRSTQDEPVHEDPTRQGDVLSSRALARQQTETDYTPDNRLVKALGYYPSGYSSSEIVEDCRKDGRRVHHQR
jgi:hypothetical protein